MEDLRAAITFELGFQTKRGLITCCKGELRLEVRTATRPRSTNSPRPGVYYLGDPDDGRPPDQEFYEASGGFGTLLLVTGKDWATREKRARSLSCSWSTSRRNSGISTPVRVPDSAVA